MPVTRLNTCNRDYIKVLDNLCSHTIHIFMHAYPAIFHQAIGSSVMHCFFVSMIRFVADPYIVHRALDLFTISWPRRSEEHTSELQSLMRISYAVFCLKKKKQ